MNQRFVLFTLFLVLASSGCLPRQEYTRPKNVTEQATVSPLEEHSSELVDEATTGELSYGYLNRDGNHFVSGEGQLDNITPLKMALPFSPAWIVGVEMTEGSGWVVVGISGEVKAFTVEKGVIQDHILGIRQLTPGFQPSIYTDGSALDLLTIADPTAAVTSPPVTLPGSQSLAYLDIHGDLIITDGSLDQRLEVGGLPDARLLVDDQDRILLLGRRTERYAHGVLGDEFEAGSLMLIQTRPTMTLLSEIELEQEEVFEGVSPSWIDLNGDGLREILVTVSDRQQGTYLAIYSERGELLARSSPIGRAFRWRHLISGADYQSGEITAVLTPHIGGVLQFFKWENDRLTVLAEQSGVSSHQIGSRNLDMALTGDINSDGRLEVLLPSSDYRALGAFRLDGDEVQLVWQMPLENRLSTNLAGLGFKDGSLGVAYGLENGDLYLWLPK